MAVGFVRPASFSPYGIDTRSAENICNGVARYRYLRSIFLSATVGKPVSDIPHSMPPVAIKQQDTLLTLSLVQKRLAPLLGSIRSEYMHTISIQLSPSMEFSGDGVCHVTYHGTRAQALDLLSAQEVRDALRSGPLVNLALLDVHLQDNSLAHDAEWWCNTLRERLGPVPREIRVHVDYCEYRCRKLGARSVTEPAFTSSDAPEIMRGRYQYERLWS